MSREILFRMWDKENDCYHCDWCGRDPVFTFFNECNDLGEIGCIQFLTIGGCNGNDEYIEDKPILEDSIIEQYTGLKDKNGTDIFEGDLIKTVALMNDHNQKGAVDICRVHFMGGKFCVAPDGYKTGVCLFDILITSEVEIIGNIHEDSP